MSPDEPAIITESDPLSVESLDSTVPRVLLASLWQCWIQRRQHREQVENERHNQRLRQILDDHLRRKVAFRRRQNRLRVQMLLLMTGACTTCDRPTRTVWSYDRDKQFWEFIVQRTFTAADWIHTFRLSKATFDFLCEELTPVIQKQNTLFRKAIPKEQRLAVTLWCLATGAEYRSISQLFGISKAALCSIIKEVCKAILDVLYPRYVYLPKTKDELDKAIVAFEEKWKIPNCVGALGTAHIPIVTPSGGDERYKNNGGWYSIILQAVVDHRGCFVDAAADFPGGMTAAEVLQTSSLQERVLSGDFFSGTVTRNVCNTAIPTNVVGHVEYPPLPWLVVPFAHTQNLTDEVRTYNEHVERAHAVFHSAFTRLRGRWQSLLKRTTHKTEDVPTIIAVCCVLHNICEQRGDECEPQWLESGGGSFTDVPARCKAKLKTSAEASDIRSAIMKHFMSTNPL